MAPLSMSSGDLDPKFEGHRITSGRIPQSIPKLSHGTTFGDLYWPWPPVSRSSYI